jgi:hypothetical protein
MLASPPDILGGPVVERRAMLPPKGATSMRQLHDLAEAQALALAIVDTLPEPFVVLDESLQLLAGSRCFYEIFGDDPATTHGQSLFDLSDGQWDVPGLRQLLAAVADNHTADRWLRVRERLQEARQTHSSPKIS